MYIYIYVCVYVWECVNQLRCEPCIAEFVRFSAPGKLYVVVTKFDILKPLSSARFRCPSEL